MTRITITALLALVITASTAEARSPLPKKATTCHARQVCLYDSVGWKSVARRYGCGLLDQASLGSFARRVSSVINRCPRRVILSGPGRGTTIFAGQWVYTLGGSRRMDNHARTISVRP